MDAVESTELEENAILDGTELDDVVLDSVDIVESTEDMQDSVYVDSTEVIEGSVSSVSEQGTTTVIVTASEEVDSFENSGYEISVIFMLGLIAGLMVWNLFSRKWYV